MASTFSDLLRIEKMGKGDQNGSWGTTLNTQFELIEDAISGLAVVTHDDSANYVISALDGATDQARMPVLRVEGTLTANRNMVVPDNTKQYVIHNATTGGFDITVKTSGGTGVAVQSGQVSSLYVDETGETVSVSVSFSSLTAKTTLVDADSVPIADSAASGAPKKITVANMKNTFAVKGTVSTAAPSGGANGDVWYQVDA